MKRSRSKRARPPSPCILDDEPLRSIQRGDGVWESIEANQDDTSSPEVVDLTTQDEEVENAAQIQEPSPRASHRPSTSERHQTRHVTSTSTQTSEPSDYRSLPSPTKTPPETIETCTPKETPAMVVRAPTPTRADLIARVLHCPLPHPGLGLVPDEVIHVPPSTTQQLGVFPPPPPPPPPPPLPPSRSGPERRQRGRPRKAGATPQQHRRRVRFSDPAPAEAEPELRSRDSHVFVRLVRVNVILTVGVGVDGDDGDASSSPARTGGTRRLEFVWNNRIKGWRSAAVGRRSDEDFVDLVGLFASPSDSDGASGRRLLRPVILPIEGGGVRQPVEMAWDAGRFCFQGANQDGETLSVTLGEMRESARDPWARQFVGYVMR